jgi:hypothetical protein
MGAHTCHPSIREVEVEGSKVQRQPELHNKNLVLKDHGLETGAVTQNHNRGYLGDKRSGRLQLEASWSKKFARPHFSQ